MDGVRVEAYGNIDPLDQVASVPVPDPRTILIPAVGRHPAEGDREGDRQVGPRALPERRTAR